MAPIFLIIYHEGKHPRIYGEGVSLSPGLVVSLNGARLRKPNGHSDPTSFVFVSFFYISGSKRPVQTYKVVTHLHVHYGYGVFLFFYVPT